MSFLRITPENVLEFRIDSGLPAHSTIVLQNLTTESVAFKVRTTAPNNYLVRPNAGVIPGAASQEISIILQLSQITEAPEMDKFLIQAVTVPSPEAVTLNFWNDVPKENLQRQRINVSLISGDHTSPLDDEVNAAASANATNLNGPAAFSSGSGTSGLSARKIRGAAARNLDDQSKYSELVNYCLALEKQKSLLEKENEFLKKHQGAQATPQRGLCVFFISSIILAILVYMFRYAPSWI